MNARRPGRFLWVSLALIASILGSLFPAMNATPGRTLAGAIQIHLLDFYPTTEAALATYKQSGSSRPMHATTFAAPPTAVCFYFAFIQNARGSVTYNILIVNSHGKTVATRGGQTPESFTGVVGSGCLGTKSGTAYAPGAYTSQLDVDGMKIASATFSVHGHIKPPTKHTPTPIVVKASVPVVTRYPVPNPRMNAEYNIALNAVFSKPVDNATASLKFKEHILSIGTPDGLTNAYQCFPGDCSQDAIVVGGFPTTKANVSILFGCFGPKPITVHMYAEWQTKAPNGIVIGRGVSPTLKYTLCGKAKNPAKKPAKKPAKISPRLFFYIAYVNPGKDPDLSFLRAAETWERETKNRYSFKEGTDRFLKVEVRTVSDFVSAWRDIYDQQRSGESVMAGAIFSHSSLPGPSSSSGFVIEDGLEFAEDPDARHNPVSTLTESMIQSLPKLNWSEDTKANLELFGCNTGVVREFHWSPASVFAGTQRVNTTGELGFAYFSENSSHYVAITQNSARVYLEAFAKGENVVFRGSLNDGLRIPPITYGYTSSNPS